ncbi:uncharacterized protein AMSG_01242 [Thecamonas trahens ATCC 50062]|uniref:BHLH domain-containing protein n=1 Tax=Thecamonas trahens ATCC 50062 TaxID=461836 RepID=A0A0L0DMI2_THETB|nr:hypothetical protein AMSG_01242 [Thecamonas trahens ATCC 50062]KNC53529.1 hypothetical protein AMSG_01242 [Thecamonas trahens ATCC 50062]|eukprot:XP_013761850.1 hypothetical protein AMSG_01242 [Thecamonas trahens ATCC 50062]
MNDDEIRELNARVERALEDFDLESMTEEEAQQVRRRVHHRSVEKQRRDGIKLRLARLTELVPSLSMARSTKKTNVLQETIKYMTMLRRSVAELETQMTPEADPKWSAAALSALDEQLAEEERIIARVQARINAIKAQRVTRDQPPPASTPAPARAVDTTPAPSSSDESLNASSTHSSSASRVTRRTRTASADDSPTDPSATGRTRRTRRRT